METNKIPVSLAVFFLFRNFQFYDVIILRSLWQPMSEEHFCLHNAALSFHWQIALQGASRPPRSPRGPRPVPNSLPLSLSLSLPLPLALTQPASLLLRPAAGLPRRAPPGRREPRPSDAAAHGLVGAGRARRPGAGPHRSGGGGRSAAWPLRSVRRRWRGGRSVRAVPEAQESGLHGDDEGEGGRDSGQRTRRGRGRGGGAAAAAAADGGRQGGPRTRPRGAPPAPPPAEVALGFTDEGKPWCYSFFFFGSELQPGLANKVAFYCVLMRPTGSVWEF